ncbi:MAG: hypothetical protein ACW99V_09430, partial [Candidatus Thorarchaeota archaeon]
GALILTFYIPRLVIYYNYLAGAPSPIDQVVLVLLGPDLSRIVVFTSSIFGMMIGLTLSHFITTKLDVVRKEGEVELSASMYMLLFGWWWFLWLPFQMIFLLQWIVYGIPTSHFLDDLGLSLMAGYSLAFAVPIMLKYVILVRHAKSIDSRVELIELRRGSGLIKWLQYSVLRIIPDYPDP